MPVADGAVGPAGRGRPTFSPKDASMNRVLVVAGVLLVSVGLLSLKYPRYSWQEETTATISTPVVDIELPTRQPHTISVPPGVSWGAAGLGWVLVFVGVGYLLPLLPLLVLPRPRWGLEVEALVWTISPAARRS